MKVLLGLSGGIDSAVAVSYLQHEGHSVEGAFLIMHDEAPLDAARRAASELAIPLVEIDCRRRFDEKVIENFGREYLKGKTPNPCVICNPEVKFFSLFQEAERRGFDRIATGHYADIRYKDGRYRVIKGADSRRDQSYMLARLGQDVLARLILPLGRVDKQSVRDDAVRRHLSAASAGESREICFIPDHDYAGYIERRWGKCPEGNFVDRYGKILGQHKGLIHYTVGQRRGLSVATGERMFVSEIRPKENEILLMSANDRPSVTHFCLSSPVYSGMAPLKAGEHCSGCVAVRYQAKEFSAMILQDGDFLHVRPNTPLQNATPGQSAVVYLDDEVMLSGIIDSVSFD